MSKNISSTLYGLSRIKKREKIAEEYNLDADSILDLSGGDNLFTPPSLLRNVITTEIKKIDLRDSYPIDYSSFIEEIGRFIGIDTNFIYPGLSHTTLLQRSISILTEPKATILILVPEKDIFLKIANNNNLNIKKIHLSRNYELDLDFLLKKIEEFKPSVFVFSSPHYPTGNQFSKNKILKLAKITNIDIIVDESYVEFAKYSLVNQVKQFSNLTVIRSFSKAWGLGAFSCAYLVSNNEIITKLKNHFLIEEIPPIHVLAATYILQNPYRFVEFIENFIQERKRVYEHLQLLNGVKTYRSDTNFIFMQFKTSNKEICEHLYSKGIIVQNFETSPPFENKNKCILATLGNRNVNDKFIIALIEVLEALI